MGKPRLRLITHSPEPEGALLRWLRQMYPAWRITQVQNGCIASRVSPIGEREKSIGLLASIFCETPVELASALSAQVEIAHIWGLS